MSDSLSELTRQLRQYLRLFLAERCPDASKVSELVQILNRGDAVIRKCEGEPAEGEYRAVLEELSMAITTRTLDLRQRSTVIQQDVDHARKVNQWTRTSAQTL